MTAAESVSNAPASQALRVKDVLAKSIAFFTAKGIETARLDAERMLAEVLGIDRLEIYLEPDRAIADEERDRLRELVKRRSLREPAQYILGNAGFYALELRTDARALIPRRETELLVDRAREIALERAVKALDLGTGCGCIALALAKHLAAGSRVWATDISPPALDLARENAATAGLTDAVVFAAGDLYEALPHDAGPFDIIAANLPYIPSGDIAGLMPEVRDHEPRQALDGGADGLDVIRACVSQTPPHVAAGGWLLLEVGMGQAPAALEMLRSAGLEPGDVLQDAASVGRVVQGRRTG
jgi:release factor glutamine methyltransferase